MGMPQDLRLTLLARSKLRPAATPRHLLWLLFCLENCRQERVLQTPLADRAVERLEKLISDLTLFGQPLSVLLLVRPRFVPRSDGSEKNAALEFALGVRGSLSHGRNVIESLASLRFQPRQKRSHFFQETVRSVQTLLESSFRCFVFRPLLFCHRLASGPFGANLLLSSGPDVH